MFTDDEKKNKIPKDDDEYEYMEIEEGQELEDGYVEIKEIFQESSDNIFIILPSSLKRYEYWFPAKKFIFGGSKGNSEVKINFTEKDKTDIINKYAMEKKFCSIYEICICHGIVNLILIIVKKYFIIKRKCFLINDTIF